MKESSYYSTITDETTDFTNKKQFGICIRWVCNELTLWLNLSLWPTNCLNVFDYFFGLVITGLNANKDFFLLHELSVTNAETLTFILKDVVLILGLDTSDQPEWKKN